MLVSSCRCSVLVSRMHPVVIRNTAFCTVCSLFVFMSDIIGDQIGLPYSTVVLVMTVHVLSSVSLDFPQCVVVSAFSIFVVFFALSVVFCICFAKVCLGSNVRPSIFIVLSVGSVVFIVSLSFVVECSAGCEMNSIVCVFEGFRIRLFCLVQLNMSCRYE